MTLPSTLCFYILIVAGTINLTAAQQPAATLPCQSPCEKQLFEIWSADTCPTREFAPPPAQCVCTSLGLKEGALTNLYAECLRNSCRNEDDYLAVWAAREEGCREEYFSRWDEGSVPPFEKPGNKVTVTVTGGGESTSTSATSSTTASTTSTTTSSQATSPTADTADAGSESPVESEEDSSPPIGAIVGGVIGGLVVLLGAAAWFIMRRRRRRPSQHPGTAPEELEYSPNARELHGQVYAPNELATDKNMTELPAGRYYSRPVELPASERAITEMATGTGEYYKTAEGHVVRVDGRPYASN